MTPRFRRESPLQQELLRFLRPPVPRLTENVSERARPRLAEVGRSHATRPAAEILVALEDAVRSVGGEPDRVALAEFAEQIEAGENPFT
jgi:hypothetical protein